MEVGVWLPVVCGKNPQCPQQRPTETGSADNSQDAGPDLLLLISLLQSCASIQDGYVQGAGLEAITREMTSKSWTSDS